MATTEGEIALKKTDKFAIQEAYVQGYKDCQIEMDSALQKIEEFYDSPENALAIAINNYLSKVIRK